MGALVAAINELNSNDTAYTKAIGHKIHGVTNKNLRDQMKSRMWGIKDEDVNFVDAFQCYVCKRLSGAESAISSVSANRGLQCPAPVEFMPSVKLSREEFWWPSYYHQQQKKYTQLAKELSS